VGKRYAYQPSYPRASGMEIPHAGWGF
jgi:hypothetical protein